MLTSHSSDELCNCFKSTLVTSNHRLWNIARWLHRKVERIPFCDCMTVSAQSELFPQPKTALLRCAAQALDCDLIYNTSLNAFNGGSANSWPPSQQDSGFIFMPGWRHSAGRLIYSHAVLYLVAFDSGARLSSDPPRPLQASLALRRHTQELLYFEMEVNINVRRCAHEQTATQQKPNVPLIEVCVCLCRCLRWRTAMFTETGSRQRCFTVR